MFIIYKTLNIFHHTSITKAHLMSSICYRVPEFNWYMNEGDNDESELEHFDTKYSEALDTDEPFSRSL